MAEHLKSLTLLRWPLGYAAEFTHEQTAKLKYGFVPMDMDDRWLIRFQRNRVDFHRSWSGICMYRLVLADTATGCRVTGSWVNRNPWQYRNQGLAEDRQILERLIHTYLLADRRVQSDVSVSNDH